MTSPSLVIVSAGLRTGSLSRVLAREAQRVLQDDGQPTPLVDLRDHPLPFCDGDQAERDPRVDAIGQLLRPADALLVATPIYNFDANAALKNLIELTGDAWEQKVVGFLCAAGGQNSYMSILPLANSLMLDFRSVIVPRFVYATSDAFADGRVVDADVQRRIAQLARETRRLAAALRAAPACAA